MILNQNCYRNLLSTEGVEILKVSGLKKVSVLSRRSGIVSIWFFGD